jgi:hypothetical protein
MGKKKRDVKTEVLLGTDRHLGGIDDGCKTES